MVPGLALLGGVVLLALPAATLLAATAGFALGLPVSALALAVGAAAASAVAWGARARAGGLRRAAALFVLCAAFALATLPVALLRYDTSWDGQTYHQQAVIALARGWNPFAAPLAPGDFTFARWDNAMAKGTWVVEAALYRLTGRLEAAKGVHLVVAAGSFLCALAALVAVPGLGKRAALACAALAALNPVTLTQASTFYVDGHLASAILAFAACAFLAIERRDHLALLGMLTATVLLATAKLSGAFYAAVLWALACAAALARAGMGRALRLGAAGAAALALAVLGPGWNPYVTNTVRHGHPFYPMAGPRGYPVVAGSRPPEFERMNRAERLLRSTFAATSNDIAAGARLKVPFTLVGTEAPLSGACDLRLGGFGPFFGGALLLSLGALAFATRRGAAAAGLVGAGLLATVLSTGEGWWARLAPQFWLVPVTLALAPLASPARRGARLAGALALAALLGDAALVAVNNVNRGGSVQRELRRQLAALAAGPQPVDVRFSSFEAIGVRLGEAGIRFRAVDELPCAAPVYLAGTRGVETGVLLCMPAGSAEAPRPPRGAP
jgi:hypothetical protein